MTQPEADAYCKALGGNGLLFQIDSDDTQDSIFSILDVSLGQQGYQYAFRVDGLRDTADNQWYYYDFGKAPAFAGLKWYMTSDTLVGFDSLVITNMAWPAAKVVQSPAVDGVQNELDKVLVLCQF